MIPEPFTMIVLWMLTLGPGVNEHGIKAMQDNGVRPALEKAWDERDPYDASSLKGVLGNFGND